ncbi:MAG: carboxylating nicotinate-nucleotide diphosphorylase [Clostridiaceae bacterium]|nr:carboxylating nicotinate-nucleotide diphosphorylase [Clostridiaceae bacterium]
MLDMALVDEIILRALKEDMPMGDITTDSIIEPDAVCSAKLIAKEPGVLAGLKVFERVFFLLDPKIQIDCYCSDGEKVETGTLIMRISGNTRAILKAERTALNILQRMSGIATETSRFVDVLKGSSSKIVDTRKTAPGIRYLDKYAVRAGGGTNHRYCLSDGILIKDNHIKAAGSITKAVKKARAAAPHTIRIEVETETMEQVKEALEAGADIIMLDNMGLNDMKKAVDHINGRALTEASGNVTLDRVHEISKTGVDLISSGSLTHTVKAMDISLRFE